MSTPDRIRPSALPAARRPLAFRTSGGKLVTPQAGERVKLDDQNRMVDFVFVIDTTGSMKDKTEGLQRCMEDFVNELAQLKLDWRFSLLPFGDLTIPGDRVVGKLAFVTNAEQARQMIRSAPRFSGGGNSGESSLEAMQAAMAKSYRQGAVKVVTLMTDEPPLTSRRLTPDVITRQLQQGEFICFAASPMNCGFEAMAKENGGQWYPIGSSLNTADLLAFLRRLLKNISRVSNDVHRLGGGSVSRYLASPNRTALE